MSSVRAVIKILDNNLELKNSEIPNDMTTREVVNEIVDQLSLPRRNNLGEIITYRILSKSLGRSLSDNETLACAGVPSDDTLLIHREERAGGTVDNPESRINFDKSSIGLPLDNLTAVDIRTLLANEPALMMTLHSYRTTLTQLEETRKELGKAHGEIRHLNDRLKEKNIATVLLLLGQIQIGFGTNLVTNSSTGGWFVFFSGLAMNLGALFFTFFGLKRSSGVSMNT